jgi:hypothetical protein
MSETNPQASDAILGGQNPPPINAAVLGGEVGKKKRLQYEKSIARQNKFWRNFEYLDGIPHGYTQVFADLKVVNFEPDMKIINPQESAYALRIPNRYYPNNDIYTCFQEKLNTLLQNPRANEIKALVFGFCSWTGSVPVDALVSSNQKLKNLTAVFLGDIEDREVMISSIKQSDVSPILTAYTQLEILHIRGDDVRFSNLLQHETLKALRIESGGLHRQALSDLDRLELPALEYLELWLGSDRYGGNSSIADLILIISGNKFPKLKYLGLKNCEYTDDIAFELSRSPILEQLLELDLSMGSLSDKGLLALLNHPMINELDKLNISQNFISDEFIAERIPQFDLKCELIINGQRHADYDCDYDNYGNEINQRVLRYCVVAE